MIHPRLASTCPAALMDVDQTLAIRALGFSILSRQVCSFHALYRCPMDGHPYRLFKILEPGVIPPDMGPPCLYDELAHTFFSAYSDDQNSMEARAFLESLARAIDVDLATIEAKHASTRRTGNLRGTQTWVPSLETVNCEWVCRQIAITEQTDTPELYRCKKQDQHGRKKTKKTPGKQAGARGGGGGGCRAFFHIFHKGRKMTAASIRELVEQYNNLPAHEKQKYEEIGRAGTMSWRHGNKSFADAPDRKMFPSEPELVPADVTDNYIRSDGIVVGLDPSSFADTLIPFRSRDFDSDIKKIRSRVMKEAANARKALEDWVRVCFLFT